MLCICSSMKLSRIFLVSVSLQQVSTAAPEHGLQVPALAQRQKDGVARLTGTRVKGVAVGEWKVLTAL